MSDASGVVHTNGVGHPERPERIQAIETLIELLPYRDLLQKAEARAATEDEVRLVHTPDYVSQLAASRQREITVFDLDTRATAHSYDAALRAAGAVIAAVENAVSGSTRRWFAPVRPPGHHAERDAAMGFCFLNNVAVAAAAAVSKMAMDRVAIVDWDVHHGNGTDHIFTDRSDVLYISLHQHPHYPGTGTTDEIGIGDGAGFTVNLPLPAGCTDSDYATTFDRVVLPVLNQFKPQLILVSAGFDAHSRDPLSGMQLSSRGFAGMTSVLTQLADRTAGGRIVYVLEGGYDLQGLTEGVRAVLDVLAGEPREFERFASSGNASRGVGATIEQAIHHLSPYWEF